MAQANKDISKKLGGVVMANGHVVGAKLRGYAGLDLPRMRRYGYDQTKRTLSKDKAVNKPFFEGADKDILDGKPLNTLVTGEFYMQLGKTAVVAIARECMSEDITAIYELIESSMAKKQASIKQSVADKAKESNAKKEQSLLKQAESLGLDVEALKALLKAKEQ